MRNDMPMTTHGSETKPEVELKYGGLSISQTGGVLSDPWIEIFNRNWVR